MNTGTESLFAARYRRKPTEIHAIRWVGPENTSQVLAFAPGRITYSEIVLPHLRVDTLHGKTEANIGDWILKGRIGDVWPCKPNVFAENYEAAS